MSEYFNPTYNSQRKYLTETHVLHHLGGRWRLKNGTRQFFSFLTARILTHEFFIYCWKYHKTYYNDQRSGVYKFLYNISFQDLI